jgi:hypothetical protein
MISANALECAEEVIDSMHISLKRVMRLDGGKTRYFKLVMVGCGKLSASTVRVISSRDIGNGCFLGEARPPWPCLMAAFSLLYEVSDPC